MTRSELFEAVWTKTVQGFADEQGLNYVLLHKLLNAEDIPKPGRKDIALLKQGELGLREVKRPKLPGDGDRVVTLPVRRDHRTPEDEADRPRRARGIDPEVQRQAQEHVDKLLKVRAPEDRKEETRVVRAQDSPRWNTLYFLPPMKRQRVILQADHLRVRPDGLHHALTRQYQEELMAWASRSGKDAAEERPCPGPPLADRPGNISVENYSRVFLVLDALYCALELLGEEIAEDGSVLVERQRISLTFTEGKSKVYREPTPQEALEGVEARPILRNNGKLTLSVGMLYAVKDTAKTKLEDQLGDALELIYTAAFQLANARTSEKREQQKQQKAYLQEYGRFESLLQQARDFEDAVRIRQLVICVQKKLAFEELPYRENWAEWAAWASRKAEWLDPTVDYTDPVLGRRHDPILQPSAVGKPAKPTKTSEGDG